MSNDNGGVDTQRTNEEALAYIHIVSAYLARAVEHLQGDVVPDVVDTHEDQGDDYEPGMHNEHAEGGRRFPELDQRWLAIGVTDLQKGLLALKKAAEGGGF